MLHPDLLNGELSFSKILLADLDEQVKTLLLQVSDLDLGLVLFRFLQANCRTRLTSDDIAFQIGESPGPVEQDLEALVRLGVADKASISGVTLFSLTSHPQKKQSASELAAWQDRWNARLTQLNQALLGLRPENSNYALRLREWLD